MRRELAIYLATFGSMTAAAVVVIALIVFSSGGDDPQDGGGTTVPVVVAGQNIAIGTEITEDMVRVTEVPEELIVAGAYSDTANVVGQVTRVAIPRGEQIITSRTVGPLPEGGISIIVPPDKRTGPGPVVPSPSPPIP
jgi:Flp pilus assembly protein CpaB